MSRVRVLVGTRKGAFILTADGKREGWEIAGPHFAGWEVFHVKGSPVDPDRVWAAQTSSWFGQVVQRSDDGGKTWEAVGNAFAYEGDPGTHQWYDGTPRPWQFKRVWHFEPSATDRDTVWAGVEDAALFRSTDGGATWQELPGLRSIQGPQWQPGAGGMCLHTILLDPSHPQRIFVAISAAGAFRSNDGGSTWRAINRGLVSRYIPNPTAEVGHCVHRIALHSSRPRTLFMQKHWDVLRSDDAGDSWREVSGNLPSDFGFAIEVHAHEPETIYVVPIQSDELHYPPEGRLRVYRSRTGGGEWEALTDGLPQRDRRRRARPPGPCHPARHPRRPRGVLPRAPRHPPRPGDEAAASVPPLLRLRARLVPRASGRPTARGGRRGDGALLGRGCDRRRVVPDHEVGAGLRRSVLSRNAAWPLRAPPPWRARSNRVCRSGT